MTNPRKLSRAEAGRLGGLTSAHFAGAEGMARRGAKGGNATAEKLGRAHFTRAALIRWGRLPADKEKGRRATADPKRSVDGSDTPSQQ